MIYFRRGSLVSVCEGFEVEASAAALCRRWDLPAVVDVASEILLADGSVLLYNLVTDYVDMTPSSLDLE